jgi:hypothetical protein
MKSRRLHKYLQQKSAVKNKPISRKEDIQTNSDKHIDQDFEGYPHGSAREEMITPKTKQEKKVAAFHIKDGEK